MYDSFFTTGVFAIPTQKYSFQVACCSSKRCNFFEFVKFFTYQLFGFMLRFLIECSYNFLRFMMKVFYKSCCLLWDSYEKC